MRCPICKEEIGDNSKFCIKCGKKIPRCPTCGKVVETRAKFCTGDGTLLPPEVLELLPKEAEGTAPEKKQPVRRFCTQCGKPCGEGQNLCAACRQTKKPVETDAQPPRRSFCIKCGRPCSDGKNVCVECRSKMRAKEREDGAAEPKRNTGTVILVTAVVLVILLLIGVALFFILREGGEKQEEPVSTDAYQWVNDFAEEYILPDVEEEEQLPVSIATEPAPTEAPTEPETEPVVETSAPTEPTVDVNSVEYRMEYFIENCDKEYFAQSYFDGFGEEECRLARNAIYAKSGRMFNDSSLQKYYEQYSWYVPSVSPSNFSASMLNAYQTSNINAILNFEAAHGYN